MAKNNSAHGKRLEREVKDLLEAQGWAMQQAINKTIFLGPGRIISVAHDFFNVWDFIGIEKRLTPKVWFIQVTVWEHVSDKIKKIVKTGIEWKALNCAIYGRMRGGRPPHYRVMEASDDFKWTGKTAMVLKPSEKS